MLQTRDIVISLAMLGSGLFYLKMVADLPGREGVDAATVPGALAWMMVALGLAELVRSWRRRSVSSWGDVPRAGYVTVALTLALIAGFVAALRPMGFPIAAALYLFLQMVILSPAGRRPPFALYAALAVLSAAVIFSTFRYGFDLLLPAGPLVTMLG